MRQKLLITGASGFLGWNLCLIAQEKWQVYGTYFSHPLEIPGVNMVKVDLQDITAVKEILATIKPAAVIHTAAHSRPNFCQIHPEESYKVNVTSTLNLAQLTAEYNIPFVFTSTDLVFDGKNPPYTETDPISPVCYYGEQKAIAEQKILEIHPKAAVCRMPLMFGVTPPTASSFIQPFLEKMRAGEELALFTDEIRTPVSGKTAAEGLLLAVEKQFAGLLHLGGVERVSRYQFGCLMAEVLQIPQAKLSTCKQEDVPMAAPRSPDTSLNSSQAFSLGYQPPSLREQLAAIASQL